MDSEHPTFFPQGHVCFIHGLTSALSRSCMSDPLTSSEVANVIVHNHVTSKLLVPICTPYHMISSAFPICCLCPGRRYTIFHGQLGCTPQSARASHTTPEKRGNTYACLWKRTEEHTSINNASVFSRVDPNVVRSRLRRTRKRTYPSSELTASEVVADPYNRMNYETQTWSQRKIDFWFDQYPDILLDGRYDQPEASDEIP
ncbi:hypothetical protein JB92DRAFT_1492412 [Gautieria morchelliformis]|nr:hypothetical protein JB92DRAFT_1492412 [Gautieria morchelliformis]